MASTIGLDDLLEYVRADGRVCPMPPHWDRLWKMLPGCPEYAGQSAPHAPLILVGWSYSTNGEKAERLAYHIRLAHERGALDNVDTYLRSLPEDAWHYSDSAKTNF